MMPTNRPSIFTDDSLDLGRFAPKSGPTEAPVPSDTVRRVAAESGFPSRAPAPPTVDSLSPVPAKRPLSPKTGRTVLLNARITQRAHDRFHKIVEAERVRYEAGEISHRVTLGELVEQALAALERERGEPGR
jgi:hypothetical protein